MPLYFPILLIFRQILSYNEYKKVQVIKTHFRNLTGGNILCFMSFIFTDDVEMQRGIKTYVPLTKTRPMFRE